MASDEPGEESELVRRAHYQQGAVSDSELASMGVLKMVTTQQVLSLSLSHTGPLTLAHKLIKREKRTQG